MWIKTTQQPVQDGEPHLGLMEEYELMQKDGEALEALIKAMADQQQVPHCFTVLDDYTEEEIIFDTAEYLNEFQRDTLCDMFEEVQDWNEAQLTWLVDYYDK